MSKHAPFPYSIEDVRQASGVIGGDLAWNADTKDQIRNAFTVANHWRDSHAYPMKSMRSSMRAHIRIQELNGFTAARVKRMNAIRGKLRRRGITPSSGSCGSTGRRMEGNTSWPWSISRHAINSTRRQSRWTLLIAS